MVDKTKLSSQSQVVSSVLERVSSGESEGCDEQRGFRGTLCACSHWPIQVILYISMVGLPFTVRDKKMRITQGIVRNEQCTFLVMFLH